MNLRIVTQPTHEPLTLQEAMEQLNIDLDDRHKDEWITRTIRTVRRAAEEFLNVALTDAVYEYRLDGFDSAGITLPVGGVGSIVSITYIDEDGEEQTLDESVYSFDDHPRSPTIYLAFEQEWPDTRRQKNAVFIRFTGAYSETDSPPNTVPDDIKHAMLMMLAHYDANREAVTLGQLSAVEIPLGAYHLMWPYRVGVGV